MKPVHCKPYKVAVVWRGDRQARAEASPETSRLKAIFKALERVGIDAMPAVYDEAIASDLRDQLLGVDGVLVWVDPISTSSGQRRSGLDDLLRQVAATGVLVSAHPDVIAKMGGKAVLHRTRTLGWGTDTRFYETPEDLRAGLLQTLAGGPRVLKQNRGNGGIGVWKVEADGVDAVRVLEARGGAEPQVLALAGFIKARLAEFDAAGGYVDQPFQARLTEGMVRCYMSGATVVGFGHQLVRALASDEAGEAGPRLYSGPDDPRFQLLRVLMETDWTPGLVRLLEIETEALPVIWDADFLLGAETAAGEDSYVLCEINVSSVFPMPEEAPDALAATVLSRLAAARERRTTGG